MYPIMLLILVASSVTNFAGFDFLTGNFLLVVIFCVHQDGENSIFFIVFMLK